ncbi:hypothetical protein R3P38DRAFT_2638211 [Favolaschia claudopus]|uniref:HAT C-terminal dimerisation domain-containing protein n=1 Tax=Favolaschia claudopus TaxID=2862362 RepID=A0AAW0AP41_9AGAR
MFDDAQLVKYFPAMLKALRARIEALPDSLPVALPDGPLARYFGDFEIDEEEGAQFTANRQWERAFQVSADEQHKRITRGEHGMDLICPFLEFYSQQDGIKGTDGVGMLARRRRDLNSILDTLPSAESSGRVVATHFFGPKKPAKSGPSTKPVVPSKRAGIDSDEDDPKDKSYQPPRYTPDPSENSGSEDEGELPVHRFIGGLNVLSHVVLQVDPKGKGKEPEKLKGKKSKKPDEEVVAEDDNAPVAKIGRNPTKGRWAISNYNAPTISKSRDGKPVWRWDCKWCSNYRTSPRTAGCTKYQDETINLVVGSNFLSHLSNCKHIPDSASFDAYEAAEAAEKNGTRPAPTTKASQSELQRQSMSKFIEEGIANPAVVVTKRGFRKHLVEGIAYDDHSLIPGRKTVKSDMVRLCVMLKERVDSLITSNSSKFAIAQGLWTSKNSVYAFCGAVGWLIDDEWVLREFVLELIPLDGDHSGAATGRLLFHKLDERKLTPNLFAAAGDNASSNGPLCGTICTLMFKTGLHLVRENAQIGCGGHVLNIVAQTIYFVLGIADDPDVVDYYEESRKFPLAYDSAQDPEVVAEMALMAEEAKSAPDGAARTAGRAPDAADSDSDSSDDDNDDDQHEESMGDSEPLSAPKPRQKKKKVKRKPTIVDKLHDTVVDINRSEIRRKRFRLLTREACEAGDRDLVLIRGMKIRWNTTNAEIERGVRLEPALVRWNQELPRGLTGKKKKAAERKAKQQYLSPRDFKDLRKITAKHLETSLTNISPANDTCNLGPAIRAGLEKLRIHTDNALVSDYPLLGAVLHPAIRLAHFQNSEWSPDIPARAKIVLEHLYEVYKEEFDETPAPKKSASSARTASPSKGIWRRALGGSTTTQKSQTELEIYFSGIYPMDRDGEDDVLGWWKVSMLLPAWLTRIYLLSHIAVERLFSSSKHTMSDSRSSMAASTAAATVVTKELLNAGFGEGVDFLEGVSIH